MSDRQISKCQHKPANHVCKKCGVCLYETETALKTQYFESYLNCSPSKYLKHMRKRQTQPLKVKQINESSAMLIDAICQKFQYGIQTRALGMYIFFKACQKQESNQKFWAASALMIASKGIELDKRVPYLNRYQRYADKLFPQEDYQLAEKVIFQAMNFDIQHTTFMSFLNFYMTTGIIFESDNIPDVQVRVIEDQLLQRAKAMIRHGAFMEYEPEKLAVSIIKEVRQKFQLKPWKQCLEQMSGIIQEEIIQIENEKDNILKPIKNFQNKNLEKQCLTHINTPSSHDKNSLLSSIQNLPYRDHNENKLYKTTKRHFENTLKLKNNIKQNCLKENAIKIRQEPLSSTSRHPNFSLSKISLSYSSDRIIPFNMFANRR